MSNRISYNEIRDLSEDWSLDVRNNKPYSGSSVQTFLKKVLTGKAGDFYYDPDTTRYLIFSDAESRELYLSDREEYADLVIGTFDAPANYTAEIYMQTPASNVILSGSKGNYIDFTFDVKSRTGSSTGEAVIVTYTFNNSGNVRKVVQAYSAGSSVHFPIDSYLSDGTNNISIVVTGRNTLVSTMTAVNFTVVNLKLTSEFAFATPMEVGDILTFPYSLEGAGVKYLEWYIDGVKLADVDTITDLKVTRTKSIDTSEMTAGKHNIQARAYITTNGQNFYSKTLYYDFVVCPENKIWNDNVSYALLNIVLNEPAISTVSFNVVQYTTFEYTVAAYDSRDRALSLIVRDNDVQIHQLSLYPEDTEDLTYFPTTVGTHTLSFSVEGYTCNVVANVSESDVDIQEATQDLVLKLSAKGRNNNETNPATWTYENTTTTFNNFAWNAQSGWNNNALVIPAGSSIDIDFAPLSGDPIQYGKTIEIDYETADVQNEDATILSIVDSTTNAGLSLTASSASLQSSGGANVNTKYRDGDRVHLSFIINRLSGDNGRLMFIVNNGILERAASFAITDSFSVADTMHIGSTGCTIKLHSIKVYNRALDVDEAFCNYAVDADNILEIVDNNDIINETTGLIDADKVNAKVPVLIITGDIQPILDTTDKNTTVYVDVEYRDMQDSSKNFTATHLRMRPQGTSSLGYPRKNLRLYTASEYGCVMTDGNGDVLENGLYAFKENAQPVNCWTLKADYAESSGSHSTGIARIWNDLMYNTQLNGQFVLRTEAQKAALANDYNYDVRTTIDGFPIVVFQRDDANSQMICLGQYNFNNDKSTEKVFGFTDIPGFDNTNVQCFEFLENENPICLFDDITDFDTDWSDAFESRYPDTKTPNLTPLKTLATWINSCKNNQEKWNTEKTDHFDLPKLAAYYVYLMRFGAVDQAVKNSMITTEDGQHWFFINYDNDTVMGIDNISTVLNAWDYDRQSVKPNGNYYFAGHNSVLWNCFEADAECMALVSEIDAALYTAGLRYTNLINMFDNKQCDKWCERIYNDNGVYKYITPFKDKCSAVLYMLQGSRKSYRHWWLQHRMDMYDSKWASGEFRSRIVRFIAEGAPGGTFTVTSAADAYYGYGINNVAQEIGVHLTPNGTHDFEVTKTLAIGDPVMIYNANNLSKVDLSDFAQYLSTLYINQAVGNNGESSLKSLILGNGTDTNNRFTEIGGLNVITGLEEIDIRNFTAMTNIELSALRNLHIFNAAGSGLTSFVPANSAILTNVALPSTIQSIVMNGNQVSTFTYTPTKTLRTLNLSNVIGTWDAKSFVFNWIGLFTDEELAQLNLTLKGIDWTGVTVAQLLQLGKITNRTLQGKVTLDSLTLEQYNQLVEVFGANAFVEGASFLIDAPSGVYIAGPTQVLEGDTDTYSAVGFPVSSNRIIFLLLNGQSVLSPQTDEQDRVYREYNGIKLYEATGVIEVASGLSADVTANVRARIENTDTYSSVIAVTGKKATYPSTVTINGAATINQNGTYNYTYVFDTDSYNARITNIAWSLTNAGNTCTLTDNGDGTATLNVTNTPATSVTATISCTITFHTGQTISSTKDVALVLTFPTSLTITGDNDITANGNYDYTMAFSPASFTADVSNVAWTLSTNDSVVISASDEDSATLNIAGGNPTLMTITLTCTATLSGNTTVSGNKSITVGVIAPPAPEFVDLGLPSGLLWANQNVGAASPTDAGLYFSWGNIEGHKWNDGYDFSLTTYNSTSGSTIQTDLTLAQDAAHVYLGGTCRMPSKDEFLELKDCCTWTWTTQNEVNGYSVVSNTNGNSIFLPAAGHWIGTSRNDSGSGGYFWSTSAHPSVASSAYSLNFYSGGAGSGGSGRCVGNSVRAVKTRPEYVDFGLPSGNLWATKNLGADKETDYGLYYSWGNVEGHAADSGYDFSDIVYNSTPGKSLTGDIPHNTTYDAAVAAGKGIMPSKADIDELIANTDSEWVTDYKGISGLNGRLFMKKTDHNEFIFMPAAGFWGGTSRNLSGSYGYFWSTSIYPSSTTRAYRLYVYSGYAYSDNSNRYYGYSIRPIKTQPKAVDLGLPSGTKWADRNIGATSATDAGLYFAWGETTGYADAAARNTALGRTDGFSLDAYNTQDAHNLTDSFSPGSSYDAATANLGGSWKMPTKDLIGELVSNTTRSDVTVDGVKCTKLTSNIAGYTDLYVLFPWSGRWSGTSHDYSGSDGFFWSTSIYPSNTSYAYSLIVLSGNARSDYYDRYYGNSVRGVL